MSRPSQMVNPCKMELASSWLWNRMVGPVNRPEMIVSATGSLVEYYQEISYGAFTPAGTVTVWITAPHPYTYYSDGNYGTGSYPNNSQGLLEDCVNMLDLTVDFSQFDNNGDGYAEGIFLVHAGPGAEETGDPDDIWSHAWYYEVETDDGTVTGRYSVEPEEHYDGSMIAR